MVIFDKDNRELSIPKGLGNVAVAITSGNTDTVTPQELEREIGRANQYTRSAVTSAIINTNNYARELVASAITEAKEYADSLDTDIWINGYTSAWDSNADDIESLFQKVDELLEQHFYNVINSKIWGLRVFINHGGYGQALPFSITRVDLQNTYNTQVIELNFTGGMYPSNTRIASINITLHRGHGIAQEDVETHYINFS